MINVMYIYLINIPQNVNIYILTVRFKFLDVVYWLY